MGYRDTPYALGKYEQKTLWRYISIAGGIVVGILIGIFLYSRVAGLISGPRIIVDSPTPWQEISDGWVEVSGTIRYVSSAKINDRTLYLNTDNTFREIIAVVPGYTIIEITAQDRFGKQRSVSVPITRDVIHDDPPAQTVSDEENTNQEIEEDQLEEIITLH
jgi:hypothetical protein